MAVTVILLYLTCAVAKTLEKRLAAAYIKRKETEDLYTKLNEEIKGSTMAHELPKWNKIYDEYTKKVVDMKEHKDLANPFEPREEKREFDDCSRSLTVP